MARAPKPKPSSDGKLKTLLLAGLVLILLAILGWLVWTNHIKSATSTPPPAGPPAERQQRVDAALGLVERLCLSNESETVRNAVKAKLKASLTSGFDAGGDTAQERTLLRGAAQDLSEDGKLKENDRISRCMERQLDLILDELRPPEEKLSAKADKLTARFSFVAPLAPGNAPSMETARLRLMYPDGPFSDPGNPDGWLLARDRKVGYFASPIRFPARNATVFGTITRDLADETGRPVRSAGLCFRRAELTTAPRDVYASFDCSEGGMCALNAMSPRWLEISDCKDKQLVSTAPDRRGFSLIPAAFAQETAAGWSVPSIEAWDRQMKNGAYSGAGLTRITVTSDAFRDPAIHSVEVGIAINGRPIWVDGLPPHRRPVYNPASAPFSYSFGFRSLDLRGLDGGCDTLAVALTPRGPKDARPVRLSGGVVVLRRFAEQRVPLPEGASATISAHYIPPQGQAEGQLLLVSDTFKGPYSGPGATALRDRMMALKARFDKLNLDFGGKPMVAVLRPPWRDPTYGLMLGLVEPDGRVGFVYPTSGPGIAIPALKAHILGLRANNRVLKSIVVENPLFYKLGARERVDIPMPRGVCRDFTTV